jgi:hypothetical protein
MVKDCVQKKPLQCRAFKPLYGSIHLKRHCKHGYILADNIYLDTNENDRKASHVRSRDYRFVDEMKAPILYILINACKADETVAQY